MRECWEENQWSRMIEEEMGLALAGMFLSGNTDLF